MLESIIQFLNLELSLLSYFEKRHCLSTLVTTDKGEVYPAEYLGEGNYNKIDFDAYDGVSYFRLTGQPNVERIEQKYTPKPRVNVSFPLRLVYAVRKSKLSADDAYSFDRVRTSIAKQLESDAQDLVATLKADRIEINTGNYNFNAKEVWDEETAETGQYQPRMDFIFASMDVDVIVTIKNDCIVGECDGVSSDILQAIDFCLRENFDRLTQTQKDCISSFLCGTPDPATVRNSDSSYSTTVASGATLVLPDITFTDSDGSSSSVPSVQDITATPCGVIRSVSLSVSDTTPNFGDAVTLTATASNITPTSYLFFWFDGTTIGLIAEQASNIYNWSVDSTLGSIDIYVIATDGTNEVVDVQSVTVSSFQLLDEYPNSQASYSLRQLRSSATNCIRVRRSSDNAQQDIGFVGGVLDESALTTFVGANDGFIVTWYDQQNSNDATQSTASQQPKIVSSGVVITENGEPAIQFDGSDDVLATASNPYSDGLIALFVVCKVTTPASNNGILDAATNVSFGSSNGFRFDQFSGNFRFGTRTSGGASFIQAAESDATQTLRTAIKTSAGRSTYLNGGASASDSQSGDVIFTSVPSLYIGATLGSANFFGGTMQEVVTYNSDQDSNRTGIETNINNFYTIY